MKVTGDRPTAFLAQQVKVATARPFKLPSVRFYGLVTENVKKKGTKKETRERGYET